MPTRDYSVLYLLFLFHLLSSTVDPIEIAQPYTPSDVVLLDCGETSSKQSEDGRSWDGDQHSKFCACDSKTASSALTASNQDPSVSQVPYMTSRIFHSNFTYTFPVSSGQKFIRLYFYSADYSDLDMSKSYFSLMANNYTLLNNFSASLTVSKIQPHVVSTIKEFIVPVWNDQKLDLTFHPSPQSFAFINGIEIISMPNGLYSHGSDVPLAFVGNDNFFYLDNTTALETLYRLNVGGNDISGSGDTGMYRTWQQDTSYIFGEATGVTPMPRGAKIKYTSSTPAYTAPVLVYGTHRAMGTDANINRNYNLTWTFSVDAGFIYLLRLHFCETRMEVTKENQVVFSVFINNQTAVKEADVIHWSGGNSVPVYKDCLILVPKGIHSKQNLWLALHPSIHVNPTYSDAFLNGLEIFKLNQSDGSLAGGNPELIADSPPSAQEQQPKLQGRTRTKKLSPIIIIIGGVCGGLFSFSLLLCFLVFNWKSRVKDSNENESKSSHTSRSFITTPQRLPSNISRKFSSKTPGSSIPTHLCHHFSISEIKAATNNFDEVFIIGVGGFGNVYKGFISGGDTTVAIKKLNPGSQQGANEFKAEIEMLSKLRHRHLVSLIGYCNEDGEMILVYDYMARGTLRDHLYNTDNPPLPWKRRLEICIGAARGLDYLHSGLKHTIIHRDVKTTNILLNENWEAKVSDFGLSKIGPTTMSKSHVSTVVKGSFGYLDPEYYRRQLLTEKSDVYSFGVVLFEVLCARPAVDRSPRMEDYKQANLAMWAKECYRRGAIYGIIDPYLNGKISTDCLKKFIEVAVSCLSDKGMERPSMSDVVGSLEFALELQEAAGEHMHILVAVPEAQTEDETGLDIECPLKISLTPGRSYDLFSSSMDSYWISGATMPIPSSTEQKTSLQGN